MNLIFCFVKTQTGHSTCFIADNLPNEGVVYAIDEWLESFEYKNTEAQGYNFVPMLYDKLLSNVIQRGLAKKIVPLRKDSILSCKRPFI